MPANEDDIISFSLKDMHEQVARVFYKASVTDMILDLSKAADPTLKALNDTQMDFRILALFCIAQGVLSREALQEVLAKKASASLAKAIDRWIEAGLEHTKFELVQKEVA